jgi:hypothetical protein
MSWYKESRWNYKAKNPKSSAYGIPQILGLKELSPIKQIDSRDWGSTLNTGIVIHVMH